MSLREHNCRSWCIIAWPCCTFDDCRCVLFALKTALELETGGDLSWQISPSPRRSTRNTMALNGLSRPRSTPAIRTVIVKKTSAACDVVWDVVQAKGAFEAIVSLCVGMNAKWTARRGAAHSEPASRACSASRVVVELG